MKKKRGFTLSRHSAHTKYGAESQRLGQRSRSSLARKQDDKKGFTLIELSIVLVIIGLIVGSVLVGQDLIRAAQIRAVISDVEQYQTAALTFKLKYNCLPGDCPNATTFWGTRAVSNCGASTTPSSNADKATCDGNGDKIIWGAAGTQAYSWAREKLRFWQHLAAAELIAEDLSGIGYVADGQNILWVYSMPGYNAPTLSINKKATISVYNASAWTSSAPFFDTYTRFYPRTIASKNIFAIGTIDRCTTTTCTNNIYSGIQSVGGLFTTAEAQALDDKIDDGKPAYGNVTAPPSNFQHAGNGSCATGTDAQSDTAYYNVSNGGTGCPLFINAQF